MGLLRRACRWQGGGLGTRRGSAVPLHQNHNPVTCSPPLNPDQCHWGEPVRSSHHGGDRPDKVDRWARAGHRAARRRPGAAPSRPAGRPQAMTGGLPTERRGIAHGRAQKVMPGGSKRPGSAAALTSVGTARDGRGARGGGPARASPTRAPHAGHIAAATEVGSASSHFSPTRAAHDRMVGERRRKGRRGRRGQKGRGGATGAEGEEGSCVSREAGGRGHVCRHPPLRICPYPPRQPICPRNNRDT